MLNHSSPGPLVWARYQAAEECRHSLGPEVARGLVYNLTHCRMLEQATLVYRSAVRWGTYSRQNVASRPLKLLLSSCFTMEEMCVIVLAYLRRLELNTDGSLTIFVHMNEAGSSATRETSGMRHLACVPTKKEDGLGRLVKVLGELEPPLTLAKGNVPSLPDRLVRRFLAAQATAMG